MKQTVILVERALEIEEPFIIGVYADYQSAKIGIDEDILYLETQQRIKAHVSDYFAKPMTVIEY